MKKIIPSVTFAMLSSLAVGTVSNRTYESLAHQSDVVLVATVDRETERHGPILEGGLQAVMTVFRVESVLKGKYQPEQFVLQHFTAVTTTGQGQCAFMWFDETKETYLLFLSDRDGLKPISGDCQLTQSVIPISYKHNLGRAGIIFKTEQ